jgi:hypothetical protein
MMIKAMLSAALLPMALTAPAQAASAATSATWTGGTCVYGARVDSVNRVETITITRDSCGREMKAEADCKPENWWRVGNPVHARGKVSAVGCPALITLQLSPYGVSYVYPKRARNGKLRLATGFHALGEIHI